MGCCVSTWGLLRFHMGWCFGEVAAVESLSHGYAVPAPFGKGAAGSARRQFRTGIFCESLLPLQCPVSLPCRIGKENNRTLHAMTAAARRPFGKGAAGSAR